MKDKNIDIEEDDASLLAECDRIYREICKQKGISFDDLLGEMVDGVGFTGIVVPEVEDDGISSLDVMADLNTGKPTDTWISLYGSKAS